MGDEITLGQIVYYVESEGADGVLTCSPAIVTEIHTVDCVNLGIIRNHSASICPETSVIRGSLPGNFQESSCVDRVPAASEPCEEVSEQEEAPGGQARDAGEVDQDAACDPGEDAPA